VPKPVTCLPHPDRTIIAATTTAIATRRTFLSFATARAAAAALACAFALHLAFPPAGWWWLAPFAFAPLWLGRWLLLGLPIVAELTFNKPWAYAIARIGTHWTASALAAAAIASALVVARRPRFATPMLVCAALCALTINDTALKIGRWPYVVDRTAYARAATLRASGEPALVPRPQEGVYAVAAANPRVALRRYAPGEAGYCPAYDTNARAFFASLGAGTWPANLGLCGGVPVARPPAATSGAAP